MHLSTQMNLMDAIEKLKSVQKDLAGHPGDSEQSIDAHIACFLDAVGRELDDYFYDDPPVETRASFDLKRVIKASYDALYGG